MCARREGIAESQLDATDGHSIDDAKQLVMKLVDEARSKADTVGWPPSMLATLELMPSLYG